MEKIRYLMSMTPEKSLVAGMMIVISFLATGWGVTEYNYSKYRNTKEKQISDMERRFTLETISFYNRIIDGQTKRQDRLDSALSQVKQILETKSK